MNYCESSLLHNCRIYVLNYPDENINRQLRLLVKQNSLFLAKETSVCILVYINCTFLILLIKALIKLELIIFKFQEWNKIMGYFIFGYVFCGVS